MAHNPGIQILLTRPARQSARYGEELRRTFGKKVKISQAPLLEITPSKCVIDLTDVHHLLFTSINGVQAFSELSDTRDVPSLCVGGRTAQAARAIGLQAESADGSVEDLATLMANHRHEPGYFLYLRGQHVSRSLGKDIREAVVYHQRALPLSSEAISALSGPDRVLLPLFSPRTARLLMEQVAGMDMRNVTAIAISQNVADCLEPAHFAQIRVATRPNAAAVTREIAASL